MRLMSCHIFGFGSFCDKKIEFNENLTSILEQNGFGKSTLAAFIKSILFGLETARKDDTAISSDRLKYTPWNTASFGGSITFECDKGTFTATRKFASLSKTGDTFVLIDLNTGIPSAAFSEKLGNELFGIDKEGFERSTFLGGETNFFALPSSLRHKIGEESDNAEDLGGFDPARVKLENAIKKLNEKNGEIFKLNKKINENKAEIEKHKVSIEEYLRLKEEIEHIKKEILLLEEKDKCLEEKLTSANTYESNKIKLENYNKLVSEIKSKQNDILILEKSYNEKMPEKKRLDMLSETLEEYLNKKVILEHNNQRFLELKDIQTDFSGKEITKEQILSLDKEIVKIDTHNAIIKELNAQNKDKKEKLLSLGILADTLPDDNEINEVKLAVSDAQKPKNLFISILLPVSILGILAGIGISFLNLYIGLGALSVFSLALILSVFYLSFNKKLSQNAPKADSIKRAEFLVKYGFSRDANFDIAVAKINEAKNIQKQIQENQKRIDDENISLAESLKSSWETMDKFAQRKDSIKETLEELKVRFNRYLNEVLPLNEDILKLQNELNALKEQIQKIFLSFGKDVSASEFEKEAEKTKTDLNNYNQMVISLNDLNLEREKLFDDGKIDKIVLPEQALDVESVIEEKRENLSLLNTLKEKCAERERNANILSTSQEESNLLENENSDLYEQIAVLSEKKELLCKTLEFLISAKDTLTSKYASKVTGAFEKYKNLFFNNTEDKIRLDQNLEISVIKEGIARYPQNFSQGQQSVIDVCLRFALVDAMFEKEKPFVILDDPFVNLDSENLKNAINLLKAVSEKVQIIYLTCHNSRTI